MGTPRDRYIKIGTFNARYWAEGGRGSPVLLIHGIGGSIETWLPSFDALAAAHRAFAVDLLGHGRTDKPLDASYEIADLVRFEMDFMAALGIEKAHVVGHSLGGAIGTRLALLHPAAVGKLVLVASAGLGKEAAIQFRIASIPLLGELLTRPSRSATANSAKLFVYDASAISDEALELSYQISSLPFAQQAFLRTLRASGNLFGQDKGMYRPNLQGLASIDKPALVMWGRQDRVLPVAHADVAAKGIPDARLRIFEDCGHLPMLEHSRAFNESLLDFLSD